MAINMYVLQAFNNDVLKKKKKKKNNDFLKYELSSKVSVVAQLCPTLCNPMGCSPPDSSVHGILQARILEWLPFLSPGALPDPGIEPTSPAFQADALPSEPPEK